MVTEKKDHYANLTPWAHVAHDIVESVTIIILVLIFCKVVGWL